MYFSIVVFMVKGRQSASRSGFSGGRTLFFEGGAFREIRKDLAGARMRRGRAHAVPSSAKGPGASRAALCRAGWGQGQS